MAAQEPPPRGVLIDLAATADLDVTTTDMLFELVGDLRTRSIEVLLAQVKGTVRDRLRKTGLMDELGEDRVYLSITSAVTDFQRRWPGHGPPADRGRRGVDRHRTPCVRRRPPVTASRRSAISTRSRASSSRIASERAEERRGGGDLAPASGAGAGPLGGGTSRLARMLARAPMIPTPANMTNTPVIRPSVVTGYRSP